MVFVADYQDKGSVRCPLWLLGSCTSVAVVGSLTGAAILSIVHH